MQIFSGIESDSEYGLSDLIMPFRVDCSALAVGDNFYALGITRISKDPSLNKYLIKIFSMDTREHLKSIALNSQVFFWYPVNII